MQACVCLVSVRMSLSSANDYLRHAGVGLRNLCLPSFFIAISKGTVTLHRQVTWPFKPLVVLVVPQLHIFWQSGCQDTRWLDKGSRQHAGPTACYQLLVVMGPIAPSLVCQLECGDMRPLAGALWRRCPLAKHAPG